MRVGLINNPPFYNNQVLYVIYSWLLTKYFDFQGFCSYYKMDRRVSCDSVGSRKVSPEVLALGPGKAFIDLRARQTYENETRTKIVFENRKTRTTEHTADNFRSF